jgi:UDP-glucose 4-epimerase
LAKRILLTGGAGYIGSHTYVALLEAGYECVVLDNFSNAARRVPPVLEKITGVPVQLVEGDVLDRGCLDRIFGEHHIDAVIHFAALKSVGESVANPLAYIQCNIGGLVTLMQAMETAGVFHLVFSSSASVYGTPKTLPVPETASLSYASPYGYTKLACEQIIAQACAADPKWAVGVLRYFNPVGAHPSGMIGEDPKDIPNNLMPYIAKVAAGELPQLSVFGNDYPTQDGTGVRDYIHVCDLAAGHVLSLKSLLEKNAGHLVNLGTGQGYSVLELLAAYSKACGRDLPYEIVERRPGDPAASFADPQMARDVLGFEASHNLDEMCASSWHWINTGAKNEAAS